MESDTQVSGVPLTRRLDESKLCEVEDDFASARMLGTAMLVAIVGYTAIGIELWRRGRSRRR